LGFPSRDAMEKTRDRVNQYVSSLTVDNVMVTVLSKTFEGQTDAKERWYGTDYRVRPIPSSTLDKWRRGLKPSNLQIDFPRPNPFIPTEAGLRLKRPPPASDALASSQRRSFESRMRPPPPPRVILDDDRWTVHFLEDERFGQPKGYLIFQILTQDAFATPMQAALSNLYEICVSDRLREYAYDGASPFFVGRLRGSILVCARTRSPNTVSLFCVLARSRTGRINVRPEGAAAGRPPDVWRVQRQAQGVRHVRVQEAQQPLGDPGHSARQRLGL
jgi:Middle or third domain of peptidase_M16